MPDCKYCDESFDSESAYLSHLESTHEGELGPIDRRRIGKADGDDDSSLPTALIGGVVVGVPVLVLAYLFFFTGSTPGETLPRPEPTPTDVGEVHFHGTIDVRVAGETLDFSRAKFQNPREYPAFHFEGGDGEVWHGHARQVTLAYAMWTLGIGVTADSVTYDGTTYTDGENASVSITVNNESVNPTEYVLQGVRAGNAADGDHIRIRVEPTG